MIARLTSLRVGVDVNMHDSSGESPLVWASRFRSIRTDTLQFLLNRPGIDVTDVVAEIPGQGGAWKSKFAGKTPRECAIEASLQERKLGDENQAADFYARAKLIGKREPSWSRSNSIDDHDD